MVKEKEKKCPLNKFPFFPYNKIANLCRKEIKQDTQDLYKILEKHPAFHCNIFLFFILIVRGCCAVFEFYFFFYKKTNFYIIFL